MRSATAGLDQSRIQKTRATGFDSNPTLMNCCESRVTFGGAGVVSATSSAGSPDQRQVFRLAFFEKKSQREISALTQTPLGTVKTRIELGIKKLSHALGGLREKVV